MSKKKAGNPGGHLESMARSSVNSNIELKQIGKQVKRIADSLETITHFIVSSYEVTELPEEEQAGGSFHITAFDPDDRSTVSKHIIASGINQAIKFFEEESGKAWGHFRERHVVAPE